MNELMKIMITNQWDNMMIKEVLFDHFQFSSKSLTKIKISNGIFLNDKSAFITNRVKSGDVLTLFIPIEKSEDILPQPIPIDIRYEDQDIVIINKPPNIVVHPTRNHYLGTIANGLIYHWQTQGKEYRFRPVHRLDKDTTGLFVVAKNQYSHHKLALQLNNRSLKRTYHAIVHGKMNNKEETIRSFIVKDPEHAVKRIIVPAEYDGAKEAITSYKIIESFEHYSLVELNLLTGRTHQIRVHMSRLGHPLVGDELYGGVVASPIHRQALHASGLELHHPITSKYLRFSVPYPEDMNDFLTQLRKHKHC